MIKKKCLNNTFNFIFFLFGIGVFSGPELQVSVWIVQYTMFTRFFFFKYKPF